MGNPARYACSGKEMLGWIHEKMATPESTPRGGRFFASSSITTRNGASACNESCALGEDYSITTRNSSWDNVHTFDLSSKGKRSGRKPSILVQCTQRMGGSLDG